MTPMVNPCNNTPSESRSAWRSDWVCKRDTHQAVAVVSGASSRSDCLPWRDSDGLGILFLKIRLGVRPNRHASQRQGGLSACLRVDKKSYNAITDTNNQRLNP